MRAATLGALMSTAVFAACFVERPSQDYACKETADCAKFTDNRQCQGGYCVIPNCPSDCKTCDEIKKTCTAECTSTDNCGSVTCPSGWTCTINCTGGAACDNISCQANSKCTVTCSGGDSCGSISCRDACSCDVSCMAGTSCQSTSCPIDMGGTRCTTDGTNATPCVSTPQGCVKC